MKKTLSMLALALTCSSVSYAQIEKGTKNLGLNFGYGTNKSEIKYLSDATNSNGFSANKTTSIFIGPSLSYFLADKIEIGTSLLYHTANIKTEGGSYLDAETKNHQYTGAIYLRKHFLFSENFGLRTGPFASYTHMESRNDEKQTNKQFSTGIDLGFEYFPAKRFGIAANIASLSYEHNSQDTSNSSAKDNSFAFSLTNNLNLSVFLIIGKSSQN